MGDFGSYSSHQEEVAETSRMYVTDPNGDSTLVPVSDILGVRIVAIGDVCSIPEQLLGINGAPYSVQGNGVYDVDINFCAGSELLWQEDLSVDYDVVLDGLDENGDPVSDSFSISGPNSHITPVIFSLLQTITISNVTGTMKTTIHNDQVNFDVDLSAYTFSDVASVFVKEESTDSPGYFFTSYDLVFIYNDPNLRVSTNSRPAIGEGYAVLKP